MREPASRKSQRKPTRYIVNINGGKKARTRKFNDRVPALKLAEAMQARGLSVTVVNHQGTEIFESVP